MSPRAKYLARHAEPEAALAASLPLSHYHHVLVIPARQESSESLTRVWQAATMPLLIIVVVNASSPDDTETRALLDELTRNHAHRRSNLYLSERDRVHVLAVDRCTDGRLLPARQGVGLARKIGADIALQSMEHGLIQSPFIHCTDADVQLPVDYFADPDPVAAAHLYPFRHLGEPDLSLPANLYEISMLYYVAGLRWAGSPYGFTTIGSTIAVHGDHYAAVRGFPKRNAAEDFYLLNKLAKTGVIHQRSAPAIQIRARRSDRVPFGTGINLSRIAAMADPERSFEFYHPAIFEMLKDWQAMLRSLEPGDEPGKSRRPGELSLWAEASGFDRVVTDRGKGFKRRDTF
ncbi:MAG: hypothetical protein HUJ31_06700, partial [Pseudomonadales bacterium]|nr:hypothetical protein [Pseudomonadales bacterium]